MGRYNECLYQARQELQKPSVQPKMFLLAGMSAYRLGRKNEAVELYQSVLRPESGDLLETHREDFARLQVELARVLIDVGQLSKAESALHYGAEYRVLGQVRLENWVADIRDEYGFVERCHLRALCRYPENPAQARYLLDCAAREAPNDLGVARHLQAFEASRSGTGDNLPKTWKPCERQGCPICH